MRRHATIGNGPERPLVVAEFAMAVILLAGAGYFPALV
jgi:hypothetical protein